MPVPSALMLKLTETFHCVDKLPTTVALFLDIYLRSYGTGTSTLGCERFVVALLAKLCEFMPYLLTCLSGFSNHACCCLHSA